MHGRTLVFVAVLLSSPLVFAAELTNDQLCAALTAKEVSAIVGSERSATADDMFGCKYETGSSPMINLQNSSQETAKEYADYSRSIGGEVREQDGAVLSSVAFDRQKGKTSEVWFLLDGAAVQIGFAAGLEPDKAIALVKAARGH